MPEVKAVGSRWADETAKPPLATQSCTVALAGPTGSLYEFDSSESQMGWYWTASGSAAVGKRGDTASFCSRTVANLRIVETPPHCWVHNSRSILA